MLKKSNKKNGMANKCSLCGRFYKYQHSIKYDNDGKLIGCFHDNEFIATQSQGLAIQKQRDFHKKDLVQPFNHDGTPNKDFKNLYPKV